MRPRAAILTEHELEIMKVVWELERATVRQVYEALRQHRAIAYTTVQTMMGILEDKGHLRRRKRGRAYVYHPTRSRGEVVSAIVQDFIDRVFNGSVEPLVVSLVRDRKLSEEDLGEIARLIEEEGDAR